METLLQSNGKQNRVFCVAGIALGLLCFYMANQASGATPNIEKVRWLGGIIVGAGILGLLFSDDVLIQIDREKRMLFVTRKSLFGTTEQKFTMDQIGNVRVYSVGRAQSPRSFYINLNLKNGQEIKTGKWSFDKEDIHQEALRLSEIFGCPVINPSKDS